MPAAPDSLHPAASASSSQRQEPVLNPAKSQASSPLPASIAGAFAAAAYSMQHSLEHESLPNEEEDPGLLPQLYASRIGPRSQAYYLAQFKRFDALDRSLPSWNMAAAFFTLAWCCLRGLWQEAAKYLAAITAVALIWWFGLRPALPGAIALGLGAALWLAAVAVPGLLGNGWYWRTVRQQTLKAIADAPNMAQVHSALQAQAAPAHQKLAAMLVLALPLAAAAGAGLALLPARQAPSAKTTTPTPTSVPTSAPAAQNAVQTAVTPKAAIATSAPVATPETAPATPAPSTVDESSASITPKPAAEAGEAAKAAAAAPATAPAANPAPKRSASADLQPGKFYLNVGVFSETGNASTAIAALKKSDLPVISQTLPSNKGEVTRLRSGPFDSRKRAEKAARKLEKAALKPVVFQATEAQAPSPTSP
ncbi:SPOR domain-containing protein [Comamonas fluminis]|uniref:SPOR domain-containing protein n=1 Tax=Comamonas fluminis TaxID=2796366 RepID=UPI001C497BF9|nr:SPOR domain-containing protein [Comamonas fluminis]